MVIVIVPYPCGTIAGIILIIMGIFTLPVDPEGGISTIILGIIILAINRAIVGASRPRRSLLGIQGTSYNNKNHSRSTGNITVNFCEQCDIEFTMTSIGNLCPNCQLPLKTKTSSFSGRQEPKKSFHFENQ